ncbi:MAG: METTL5 family protein [Halobacteriales archaeon]
MGTRRGLERRLGDLAAFDDPRLDLEQYSTPADVAAHILHDADLRGDLEGTVVDLGCGTGVLAIGAALRSPARVIGVERDPGALATARENEREAAPPVPVSWLVGDVPDLPLCPDDAPGAPGNEVTVVMNPPFGAQNGNRGADRAFLAAASDLASVSYSIHNAGSKAFVDSFVADAGGEVTHAFEARLDLDRQFAFHAADSEEITVEVFRIVW